MLHFRAGDSQALKAIVAAKISGTSLSLSAGNDASAKGQNPFGTNKLTLISSDGQVLTVPNVAAKMMGAFSLKNAAIE